MKHKNLYREWESLHRAEQRELAAAVLAHGDSYTFFDTDQDNYRRVWFDTDAEYNCPCVRCTTAYDDDWCDYYITRVVLTEGNFPAVYGFKVDGETPEDERYIDAVAYGHVSFITDMIPETDEVKDVTDTKLQTIW